MFTAWFYSRQGSSHRTSPLICFPPILYSETLSLYALSFKKACNAGGTKLNFDWLTLLIPIMLSTIIILINQWQRESGLQNRMFISNEYCTEFNERALYQMAFCAQLKKKKKLGETEGFGILFMENGLNFCFLLAAVPLWCHAIAMSPVNVHISQISLNRI